MSREGQLKEAVKRGADRSIENNSHAINKDAQLSSVRSTIKQIEGPASLLAGGGMIGFGVNELSKTDGLWDARSTLKKMIESDDGGAELPDETEDGRSVKKLESTGDILSADISPIKKLIAMGTGPAYTGGKDGPAHIVAGDNVNKTVLQHEMGHANEGHTSPGPIEFLKSMVYRPAYDENVMKREEEAWEHVPDSEKKEKIKDMALQTYDQSFHEGRGLASIALGGALAVPAGLSTLNRFT